MTETITLGEGENFLSFSESAPNLPPFICEIPLPNRLRAPKTVDRLKTAQRPSLKKTNKKKNCLCAVIVLSLYSVIFVAL